MRFLGKVGNFLAILAGIGMLILGGVIVYFWILNIFNPEYSGFAKGTILFIGGFIAFIGYAMTAAGWEGIRKRKEEPQKPSK